MLGMRAPLMVMQRCGLEHLATNKQRCAMGGTRGMSHEGTGRTQMDDMRSRLMRCLSTVFPGLPNGTLANANTSNTAEWDSLASVTLFALVEEEFGTELDVNALGELSSFDSILDYLQTRKVS
jgi:acyl carrier protein